MKTYERQQQIEMNFLQKKPNKRLKGRDKLGRWTDQMFSFGFFVSSVKTSSDFKKREETSRVHSDRIKYLTSIKPIAFSAIKS